MSSTEDPQYGNVEKLAGSKKVGIAKHLGAKVFVDDDERHMPIEPVEGLDCLLFGPGNRQQIMTSLPHIIIAPDWMPQLST